MALVKNTQKHNVESVPTFASLQEATEYFYTNKSDSSRDGVIEKIAKCEGGIDFLIEALKDKDVDSVVSTKIASLLSNMDPKDIPIENIMNLLKLENAYIRNLAISLLRNYGDAIKYYIVKFLIGKDRDLRIFAINVLGDVNFSESREMLLELLETEQDINVAMTAVDYLAEIGEVTDIPLLESLKERFKGDFYADFAINSAIEQIQG